MLHVDGAGGLAWGAIVGQMLAALRDGYDLELVAPARFDPSAAEDVVHNTFIKLIDKVDTYQFRAPFGMWLRQIAVTESLMYLRKAKKHNWVSTDEYSFFETCDEGDESLPLSQESRDFTEDQSIKHQLSDVLRELPEHIRLILWIIPSGRKKWVMRTGVAKRK